MAEIEHSAMAGFGRIATVAFRTKAETRRHDLDHAPQEVNHAVMRLHVGTQLALVGTARRSQQVLKTQGE